MISQRNRERLSLLVDVVMLVLIIANLALIIFDWGYEATAIQSLMETYTPQINAFYYETIHQNFFLIDMVFVTIFAIEIIIRWGYSIYINRYHRWWFYPFIHWYDVLGCIPISSLRSLRILRVFAMIPKMQRLGIVDLKNTYLYTKFAKYRAILFEEITDNVTIRILDGLQTEIERGHPVTDEIVDKVIEPRRQLLADTVTHRLQQATASAYGSYREDFQAYVNGVIGKAVESNREISTISMIPGVGGTISNLLESAIADIVYRVIDQMMADVASLDNDEVIAQITTIATDALLTSEYDQRLNVTTQNIILESIDLIKEHVAVKQWKLTEIEREEMLQGRDVIPSESIRMDEDGQYKTPVQ